MLRQIGRECFRYKISGIAMVACLVLSMMAAYYGVTIYKNIYMEYREKVDYAYPYTTYFKCYVDEASDIPVLPEGLNCNLKILDCWMYADSMNATVSVDISLYSSDENRPLISGTYADKHQRERGKPIIIVGQDRFADSYENGNVQYYELYGDAYRVVGVFGSERSKLYDYNLMIYGDCLGNHVLQRLLSDNDGTFSLVLESNLVDTEQIYNEYIKDNYNVIEDPDDSVSYGTAALPFHEKAFCIIIYIFCFSCIAIVIQFWLRQRKHEMKICRAFGFTNRKILLRLLKSMGIILAVSLLIFAVCCWGINTILGRIVVEYKLEFSWYTVLPYVGIFIVSILLVSVKSVYEFLHKSIMKNL